MEESVRTLASVTYALREPALVCDKNRAIISFPPAVHSARPWAQALVLRHAILAESGCDSPCRNTHMSEKMEVVFAGLWQCSSMLLMLTCSTSAESGKVEGNGLWLPPAKRHFLSHFNCLHLTIGYPICTPAGEIDSQSLLDTFTSNAMGFWSFLSGVLFRKIVSILHKPVGTSNIFW